jgi:hypothetical protein
LDICPGAGRAGPAAGARILEARDALRQEFG